MILENYFKDKLDKYSLPFINKISKIIAKYEINYAVAFVAWIGRAFQNYEDYGKMREYLDLKVREECVKLKKSLTFLNFQPQDFEYNIPRKNV